MGAQLEAQLNTQHLKGTVGLKSGSQAPPGVYFIAPLFYVYEIDANPHPGQGQTVRDRPPFS